MCLNMILKEEGQTGSLLFAVNERIFEFLFTFARMAVAPWLMWHTLGDPGKPLTLKAAGVGIQAFSLLFYTMIVRGVYLRDFKGERRPAKGARWDDMGAVGSAADGFTDDDGDESDMGTKSE